MGSEDLTLMGLSCSHHSLEKPTSVCTMSHNIIHTALYGVSASDIIRVVPMSKRRLEVT